MTPLDKASLRSMILHAAGVLLMVAGIGLAAMTDYGLINYRLIANRHGGETTDLGSNANVQAGPHGHMARIVGTISVPTPVVDPEFNLHVETPVLIRHVEMFEWREIRVGGDTNYDLDWVDHPLNARTFERPAGHANPPGFPLDKKQFDADIVRIDGFRLSPELVKGLPGSSVVPPDMKALPANLSASFGLYKNYLTTSAQPANPKLGDVRVSWEQIPLRKMTVFARVNGDRLIPASDASDGKGFDIEVGEVPMLDMLPDLPSPPEFVLFRRITAVVLAALGAMILLIVRRRRRDPLVALGLGAMAVGVISAVLWLGHDTWTMAAWMLFAVLGMALAVSRIRGAARAGLH